MEIKSHVFLLQRFYLFFKVFKKKEFRDERRDSFLRKAFGTGSFDISVRYFGHGRLSKCRLHLPD
jgi:hypothetical protein